MPDPNEVKPDPNLPARQAGAAKPAAGAQESAAPAAQAQFIDPERVEQIYQVNQELTTRVGELEKKTKSQVQQSQVRGWDQVSEQDLEYIVTHAPEYPDHAASALKELRQRDRASVKAEVITETSTQNFMSTNKEAFDSNTPLGKEVAKILSQNRAQPDVLSDVIELAGYRLGKDKGVQKGRSEMVNALKAASAHAPGSEGLNTPSPPSFMDMPKDEFENEIQKIKMKGFKQ